MLNHLSFPWNIGRQRGGYYSCYVSLHFMFPLVQELIFCQALVLVSIHLLNNTQLQLVFYQYSNKSSLNLLSTIQIKLLLHTA